MAISNSSQYVVIPNGEVGTADENGRVDIPRDGSESPPPPKEEGVTRPTVIVVDTSDDKEISGSRRIVKIEVMNEQWMDRWINKWTDRQTNGRINEIYSSLG